ncbi:MAG: [FeFe] hydrogenase H-cluster radical SAM maturase HydE [bacterium]|nr:[FeFe] hydrogenase H-cluster radical SAM maturase HydE [bacterium]
MEHKEILHWLEGRDDVALFDWADRVRQRVWGEGVLVRGIIELSNYCVRNCWYCGLRRDHRALNRFRLSREVILGLVQRMYTDGLRVVVLQSGDDVALSTEWIADLVSTIKDTWPELRVTLSLGERNDEAYRAWREAGADRYLLKHETADPTLYAHLHPGQKLARRLQILEVLRELGYEIGTGCIVGLPGQTPSMLAHDIMLIRELQPEMIAIGPFLPHHATPLASAPAGSFLLTLRTLALARVLVPRARLPATTALATLAAKDGLAEGLRVGCNVIMCSYTPQEQREWYTIYDRKYQITLTRAREAACSAGRFLSLEEYQPATVTTH